MSAGFDAASMNDIARAAGVSKGTLYAYFDSKEALFEALIREERAHQPERNLMFPADEPDPAKALAIYGRSLVEKITRTDKLEQARIVAFAAARFPRLGRAFYEAGPLYGAVKLQQRLDAFVAAGTLEIDDTSVAARQFIDLCLGDILKRLLFRVVDTRRRRRRSTRWSTGGRHVHEGLRRAEAGQARSVECGARVMSARWPVALPSRRRVDIEAPRRPRFAPIV